MIWLKIKIYLWKQFLICVEQKRRKNPALSSCNAAILRFPRKTTFSEISAEKNTRLIDESSEIQNTLQNTFNTVNHKNPRTSWGAIIRVDETLNHNTLNRMEYYTEIAKWAHQKTSWKSTHVWVWQRQKISLSNCAKE